MEIGVRGVATEATEVTEVTEATEATEATEEGERVGVDSGKMELTHVSADNKPKMVDVGDKKVTRRTAHARSVMYVPDSVMTLLGDDGDIASKKGPVFATAIIAGTMGVKRTSDLIPFCHPLPIEKCDIDVHVDREKKEIVVECVVGVCHKTGVEMEAMTGCSIAALTIYDMLKAVTHDIVIADTRLVLKTGGKSGVLRPSGMFTRKL